MGRYSIKQSQNIIIKVKIKQHRIGKKKKKKKKKKKSWKKVGQNILLNFILIGGQLVAQSYLHQEKLFN